VTAWERRDRPVLDVLARGVENDRVALGRDRGRALGLDLDEDELFLAMLALRDAGFVKADMREEASAGITFTNILVTGRGMQALGQWPLFEEITSPATLAAFLERLAKQAEKPEDADTLRRTADYVRSLSGAVLQAAARGALAYGLRAAIPGI